MRQQRKSKATKRTMQSIFFKPGKKQIDGNGQLELVPVRRNAAKFLASANMRTYDHMSRNNYDATVVEIWDQKVGRLEVVITRDLHGKVETIFKHPEGRGKNWAVRT